MRGGWGRGSEAGGLTSVYAFAYDHRVPCVESPLIEHGSDVKGLRLQSLTAVTLEYSHEKKPSLETQHQLHLLSSAESITATWRQSS